VLALNYPSPTLSRLIDPLKLALERPPMDRRHPMWYAARRGILRAELNRVIPGWSTTNEGRSDQRWYWAAPALLDARCSLDTNMAQQPRAGQSRSRSDEDYSTGLSKHINLFAEVFNGKVELGIPQVIS